MTAYINSLIVTMLICQISTVVTPENSKKYVRIICSLVILLTLIGPIIDLRDSLPDIGNYFSDMTSMESENEARNGYSAAASMIFSYVDEKFSINGDDVRITFITDEGDELQEIQIFVKNCPYAAREEIKRVTEEEFGVKTFVFTGDSKNE
ncbi:MAG: hypothetical protein E7672_05685 [Ruminococcaceae bacterium]|nr:hypothetical protein [Oscillospiraceae bacterium]